MQLQYHQSQKQQSNNSHNHINNVMTLASSESTKSNHELFMNTPVEERTIFQRKVSSFHFPLMTKVEASFRFSHSDVMCVSNRGIRSHSSANNEAMGIDKARRKSCQFPYEELYSSPQRKSKKSMSRIQEKRSKENQIKLEKQLHDEHRKFMSNLRQERQERLRAETDAAVVIQKYMRGFAVRQDLFPDRFLRSTKQYSEREIWDILLDATSRVGIKPTEDMLLGFQLPLELQQKEKIEEEHREENIHLK